MKEQGNAIGKNMNAQKIEYYREILQVTILKDFLFNAEKIDAKFRAYYIYFKNKLMTYIEETFLPDLGKYMGME